MRQILVIIALATVSATGACRPRNVNSAATEVSEATSLVIDNQRTLDMAIYVVEGATRRRLGTAGSLTKTKIAIPRSLVGKGREMQFVADPVGGTRSGYSQRIFVQPGDEVALTIRP